jgi:membrane-bound lytic murein transglycosylase D
VIFRALFFEHDAEIEQEGQLWTGTGYAIFIYQFMQHIYNVLRKVIILLFSVFLLSGCGEKNVVSGLPDSPPSETAETEPANDPDLQLVETEPEMCLDQELVALKQTGGWDQNISPVSQAPAEHIRYDFPVVRNKQVDMYLDLFQNRQRKQFARWLARSTKYKPLMEKTFKEAGLPMDLIYLSMIESGFYQRAYSRSHAVGLWQFMRGTGRQYHLRIDRYVDERRDAEKSTKAAANYLSDLYQEFGDWHLAVAAYNGGPGKIRSGLRKYKAKSFWELANHRFLRLETKRYVPKLIAAILIAKEPEKYGFTSISYQSPLQYDTIKVGPGMKLDAIAMISNSNVKTIKTLNQELRQGRTPLNRASYRVKIPPFTQKIAEKNISRLHSIVSTGFKSHKIRKGETLSRICRKYGVNKTTILKVNNLRSPKLVVGQNLRIPYSTITYQLLPEGSANALAAYKDSLILHRIKPGETVSKIAFKYGVPPEMIVEWNGLKSVHRIRAGQQLALYINGKGAGKPRTILTAKQIYKQRQEKNAGGNTIVFLTANKKKLHIEDSGSFRYYQVRSGDSLWTISRKFRISTTELKKWNNLKSNLIHPGSKLKLKKV